MPGGTSSRKLSVVVFVLLAVVVLASVWTASASASSQGGPRILVGSDETEGESAGSEEESAAQEEEAKEFEEESGEAESETGAGEATHHRRKHTRACVVPSVKGNTLAGARRALEAAHCGVGKIYTPRSGHGALVVSWQSASSGSRLRMGSPVSLRLALRTPHR